MSLQVQCPNCRSYRTDGATGVSLQHVVIIGIASFGLALIVLVPWYIIQTIVRINDPGKRYKCLNCEYEWMQ